MNALLPTETMPLMTDEKASRVIRGQRLQQWVERGNIEVATLARQAGVSRETVYNAFKGKVREKTYDALEAAQEHMIAFPNDVADEPSAVASTEDNLIEIELADVYGIGRIVVRGPEREDLVDSVIDIVRRIRQGVNATDE